MYAVVRDTTYDPAALSQGQARLEEFHALLASQDGYAGTVVIEVSEGRWLTVNLWTSPDQASAVLAVMGPAVGRLLERMMTAPSQTIGAGGVV